MKKMEEIETLIGNYVKNNCSREEYPEIIEILKNPYPDPVLRNALLKKWNEFDSKPVDLAKEEKREINQSLSIIHHKINLLDEEWRPESNLKKITGILTKIAAILLLPSMVVSLWYFFSSQNPYQATDSFITINTPAGS